METLTQIKDEYAQNKMYDDWYSFINSRDDLEQKMFFWLFKKTKSVYKNYWLECWEFYTNPQINKFPTLAA